MHLKGADWSFADKPDAIPAHESVLEADPTIDKRGPPVRCQPTVMSTG
jgi:hypothetical protein